MKKLIVLSLIFALSMSMSLSVGAVAGANTCGGEVCTELTRIDGGDTDNGPIIKAKWEMYNERFGGTQNGPDPMPTAPNSDFDGEYTGRDEQTTAGAQFKPSNIWEVDMDYTVCAIVTDPNGVADIDGVYVDIHYPETIAFHHTYPGTTTYGTGYAMTPDPVNGNGNSDYGLHGCGEFIEENELLALPKMEGYRLFCDTIHGHNNNLPTFFPLPGITSPTYPGDYYDYDEICGAEGELMKETAKVYCDDKDLIYEDPAGNYTVKAFAIDKSGNFSYGKGTNPAEDPVDYNTFKYLEAKGYDIDFDHVNYGNVALNSHKIVSGDLTFDGGGSSLKPTIRNTGNTRLWIWAEQDDMGLGKVGTTWNVKFDARIGNEEAEWKDYWPEVNTKLQDILDLSETEEMDFSVLITKFNSLDQTFEGTIDLSETKAPFRKCKTN